ncbi:trypsin-like peptidase domain-containing protein [Pelagicoccus enzymogenes]|uniref:trypsin-like peptidase domain-containing protein n=1 Tax=Pelagicoccus enzymogenes TaxID=2773457 RepID=UPI00280EFC84|nr:trypsin-like peptidase domain-containing protein [Pelagicoccus enzymogenes]MDQ8201136.1 trypsin-like peptidase domain-containing protein [Pelagicoccus enzymogenes]
MPNFKLALSCASLVCLVAAPILAAQEAVNVADLVEIDAAPLDRSQAGRVVSYSDSLTEARPAVVSVYAKSLSSSLSREELLMQQLFGVRPRRQQAPQFGLGSGVIVSGNGYIITNNHVISRADEIKVQLDSQRIYDAVLVGTDPSTDIAVLKIETEVELPSIKLADSDQIEVGDVVFAIGNPLGVGKTVTMGIVSATKRQEMGVIAGGFENFIQTDAPINSGNSGGALVDAKGRLIGINTLIQTDGASTGNIGIGFAVPVNLAYSVMTDLVETGAVSRGFLGVGIESLDEDKAEFFGVDSLNGALVNQVNPNTPAAEAGILAGDVIVELDGVAVDSPSDLRIKIAARKPGETVSIALIREKTREEVVVVLAERGGDGQIISSANPNARFLEGVSVASLTDELRAEHQVGDEVQGVVITAVQDDSPYVRLLPVGMVIQSINGKQVRSEQEAAQALKRDAKNMFHVAFRRVNRWVGVEVD